MTPEKEVLLAKHLEAIAVMLYEETELEQLESVAKIENTIRKQTLEYITPQLGIFLSNKLREQQ
jgi:hypothetical protein